MTRIQKRRTATFTFPLRHTSRAAAALLCGLSILPLARAVAADQSGQPAGGAAAAAASASQASAPAASRTPAVVDSDTVQSIVITAQRRSDSLLSVPLSVSALDASTLERQGVRSMADIAALTPGVEFQGQSFGAGSGNFIAIRGIMSGNVGVTGGNTANTTGVYIDDTPIQGRNLDGQYSGSAFPQVFDLERVEILRGPQGTLWGAGSEGGAVRFITPAPAMKTAGGLARFEVSHTEHGDASYETGIAYGTPIIKDVLGLRASAWTRKDGGFVDRVATDAGGDFDGTTVDKNANRGEMRVFRAALGYKPSSDIVVTPSVYYQSSDLHDTGSYWVGLSDPKGGVLRNGNKLAQPATDRFVLPALKVEWSVGGAKVVNSMSYFRRNAQATNDYTSVIPALIGMSPFNAAGDAVAPSLSKSRQRNFVEEFHVESASTESPLSWVAGVFYSDARQEANQLTADTGVTAPVPLPPQYLGLYDFYSDLHTRDQQLAAFGEADYQVTSKVKATLGLRVARTRLDFDHFQAGSFVGPTPVADQGEQQETPFTPKVGLTYQAEKNTMFYANASKGYRVGGVNGAVGPTCAGALQDLGLSSSPPTFSSDSVISYELGAKGTALGNHLAFEASVFHTDWNRIQQSVTLTCGFPITFNAGKAVSNGFDLTLQSRFGPIQLSEAVGYTDAHYTKTVGEGAGTLIRSGTTLGVAPWTSTTALQYNFVVAEHSAYARADFVYRGHNSGRSQKRDPEAVTAYDPTIALDPAVSQLNLRAGVTLDFLDGLDLAAFVTNATNTQPQLSPFHATPSSPLYTAGTVRPRTLGVTVTANF